MKSFRTLNKQRMNKTDAVENMEKIDIGEACKGKKTDEVRDEAAQSEKK